MGLSTWPGVGKISYFYNLLLYRWKELTTMPWPLRVGPVRGLACLCSAIPLMLSAQQVLQRSAVTSQTR